MDEGDGSFEDAYRWGVVEEDLAPGLGAGSGAGVRYAVPRAAAPNGLALRGCVLGPDEALENGHVVVSPNGAISSVQKARPDGVDVLDTHGVILPGLIDLHGHPEFTCSPRGSPRSGSPIATSGERVRSTAVWFAIPRTA